MFSFKSLTKYSFVLVALVPAMLRAQTSVSVNATVAASVSTSSAGTTIDLGSITPGNSYAIDGTAGNGASVTATFNTSTVTFAFPNAVTLTRSGSSETLSASVSCGIKQGSGSVAACGAASGGNYSQNASYATSGGVHGSSLATATVYAGAAVSTLTTSRAGVYSGTFSITVSNSGT